MSQVLVNAAVELFGRFDNGRGTSRPLSAHQALEGIDHGEYGAGMDRVTFAISEARRDVEGLSGLRAYRIVNEAAHTAFKAIQYTDRQVATVALSEISPEWIIETSPDPELVHTLASLVMKSRPVVREFLKLSMWDDVLDID